jgi:aminoglycoside 3-N-acetyltransferase
MSVPGTTTCVHQKKTPTTTIEDIRWGIRALGLSGRSVAVHASLSSFGHVRGGAQTVIDGVLAEGCTMMVPAFTGRYIVPLPPEMQLPRNGREYPPVTYLPTEIESEIYDSKVDEIDRHRMGAIPEAVVKRSGRARGNHPLCSFAALGSEAQALVRDQSPLKVFAPFAALAERDGWVILMGVGLERMTLLHLAEKRAGRNLFRWGALDLEGERVYVTGGGCSSGFPNLTPYLAPWSQQVQVGASCWWAFPAAKTLQIASAIIRRQPTVTHCGSPACRSCHDAVRGGPVLAAANTEPTQSKKRNSGNAP